MPVVNKDEFLNCIKKSGLASDELVALWCDGIPNDITSKRLAKKMVDNGHLTPWQAKYLLNGKTKLKFGSYVLLERIKRNEIGDTFIAKQAKLDRNVKVLFLSNTLSKRLIKREELLRQVAATASVDHPGLEHLHVVDWEAGRYMIVTDFVDAPILDDSDVLANLKPKQLSGILQQIAETIAIAHENGLSHGALTEKDIRVAANGKVTVCNMASSYLIQNLAEDNSGPVAKTKEDVSAIQMVATRLIRRLQSADSDGTVDKVAQVVEQLRRGEVGLAQTSESLLRISGKMTGPASQKSQPFSPAPPNGRSGAGKQKITEFPSQQDFAPDGHRIAMIMSVLKGAGAVLAVVLVYFAITSGWFETQSSHSSRLTREGEFDNQELPSIPKMDFENGSMPEKSESQTGQVDVGATNLERVQADAGNDGINEPFQAAEDSPQDDVDGQVESVGDLDDGQVEPLGKASDSTPPSSDSILGAFNSIKSDVSDESFDVGQNEDSPPVGLAEGEANKTAVSSIQAESEAPDVPDVTESTADFPKSVDLPEVTDSSLTVLGPLGEANSKLQLLADQNISKSKIEFLLDGPRDGSWIIETKRQANGNVEQIARIEIVDGMLQFAWLSAASDNADAKYLVNCVLKVVGTTKTQYLNLRKPVALNGFVLGRNNPQIKLDIKELDTLPQSLVAELHELDEKTYGATYLGRETRDRTFSRKNPLSLQFRELPEYQLFSLFLSADLKNRSKLEAALRVQTDPSQKARTATERLLATSKESLQEMVELTKQEHDYYKNTPIDTIRRQLGATKDQYKNNQRNEYVKSLKQLLELHEGRFEAYREIQTQLEPFYDKPIPVSIYFEVQGRRVVLATSVIE